MDIENEDNFNKFYESKYNENIGKYYSEFSSVKKKLILESILIMSVICIVIHFGFLYNLQDIIKIKVGIILLTISFMIIAIYLRLKKEIQVYIKDIVRDIVVFISKDHSASFDPDKRISEESFDKMELFNLKDLEYDGHNTILVNYMNNNMSFADIELYNYKNSVEESVVYKNGEKYIRKITKKLKRYIFKGCYISAVLNKKVSDHIYLIPNSLNYTLIQSKFMNYIKFEGEEVLLENIDFSRKYKVYSKDEIQARYILTLDLMEKINKIDDIYKGKKYIVFKEGRRFSICIEGLRIEDITKINLPIIRNRNTELKLLTETYKKIAKLFAIYDILDLGNDLYTKYI